MKIRVIVADDHTILRRGIRRIVGSDAGMEVVGEAASGVEAVARVCELNPHVVLMDIEMREMNGIEATAEIRRHRPTVAVLILSMFTDRRYVTRAVKAGARGYLVKDSEESDLLLAIRELHRGGTFFSTALKDSGSGDTVPTPDDGYEALTERERQIYVLLAGARSNKEVASVLGLSVHTVETHRLRLMEKLDLHSPAELVLSAVRRGLVS